MPTTAKSSRIDSTKSDDNTLVLNTPVGTIELVADAEFLVELRLKSRKKPNSTTNPLLLEAKRQIEEYFEGSRFEFELPIRLKGTAFQQKVWAELSKIPYGSSISYSEQALRLGNPEAVRAVGRANGQNPVPLIVPCHRVVGKDGSLVGYGGGLSIKEELLLLEKRHLVKMPARARA